VFATHYLVSPSQGIPHHCQKMVSKSVTTGEETLSMIHRYRSQAGFSLVELLIVVVIIGIIAAVAIPAFQKGIRAAENGTVFATLRTLGSSQVSFFSQNSRFARLTEINPLLGNCLGTTVGDRVVRGRHTFEMTPLVPTDAELRSEYLITATRTIPDGLIEVYSIDQTGQITRVLP
jgi:prepilin-type N-terminal cleavage/methylation domain-containing protein